MNQIATIVGVRPQFIKAGPVSRALAAADIGEILIHTGQHFDRSMSAVFFEQMGLDAPDYSLDVHGAGHGEMTGRMMAALEPVLCDIAPEGVIVYGDTNSTLAGGLTAAKLGLPVFHVEAGLRSFRRHQPEEINRRVVDHLSDLLFCPTQTAVTNLAAEGIADGVRLVGDVMYDAALHAAGRQDAAKILETLGLRPGAFEVATVHRPENTENPPNLHDILAFLKARPMPVLLVVHPRLKIAADRLGLDLSGVLVSGPLGYLEMMEVVRHSACVLTDSGGLQKEAYFHRVPCITLRDETEWPETVEAGWNRLWRHPERTGPRTDIAAFGDGTAAIQVAAAISEFLKSS